MIFRLATDDEVNWVRDNLRESSLQDIAGSNRDIDEVWQSSLYRPGAIRVAFINNRNECVAIIGMTPAPEDFRKNALFIGMYSTTGVEEEPIGFLRTLKQWRDWVFESQTCDEIITWVVDSNPKSVNMALNFLGFTCEKTVVSEEGEHADMHLVYIKRPEST